MLAEIVRKAEGKPQEHTVFETVIVEDENPIEVLQSTKGAVTTTKSIGSVTAMPIAHEGSAVEQASRVAQEMMREYEIYDHAVDVVSAFEFLFTVPPDMAATVAHFEWFPRIPRADGGDPDTRASPPCSPTAPL